MKHTYSSPKTRFGNFSKFAQNDLFASLFCLVLCLVSCDREVPKARLPETQPKLVVTSFISPQDSLLQVAVYESAPVPGRPASSQLVQNANVTMSDGNRTVTIPAVKMFESSSGFDIYQLLQREFPIEVGRTYRLRVTVPDGRAVEAQCTVPTANNTLQVEIDSSRRGDGNSQTPDYEFTYIWQAAAAQRAYYRVAGRVFFPSPDGGGGVSSPLFWRGRNEFFTAINSSTAPRLTARAQLNLFNTPPNRQLNTLDAYLLTTDENYYRYHTSLRNSIDADGNPFAEPAPVYSNVINGLGVFAAFNRNAVQIRFQ